MIRAIANQKLDLTKEEYEYYLELEKSFGKDAFLELFRTDDSGQIIFVNPSSTQPTAMILVFFLLNLMYNQKLRKLDRWVEKISYLETRIENIENKLKTGFGLK